MAEKDEEVTWTIGLDNNSENEFSADAKELGLSRKNFSQLLHYIYLGKPAAKKLVNFAEQANQIKK